MAVPDYYQHSLLSSVNIMASNQLCLHLRAHSDMWVYSPDSARNSNGIRAGVYLYHEYNMELWAKFLLKTITQCFYLLLMVHYLIPPPKQSKTPSKYLTSKLFSRIHIQTTVYASLFAYSKKAQRQAESAALYVQFQLRAAQALWPGRS